MVKEFRARYEHLHQNVILIHHLRKLCNKLLNGYFPRNPKHKIRPQYVIRLETPFEKSFYESYQSPF